MKGLSVSVYRNTSYGDCTMNGVTSKYDNFILVGVAEKSPEDTPALFLVKRKLAGVAEIFEPSEDTPALFLVKRKLGGTSINAKDGVHYLHAVPADENGKPRMGGMMGGNFIYTSDSRFPSASPIPVHDRFER
jgi:hypothetical protein